MNDKWNFDVVQWDKLTKDSANFLLSQAEKYLNETVDSSKTISEKSNKLIALIAPGSIALLVYIFNRLNERTGLFEFVFLSAVLCVPVLLRSIYFLYKNIGHYRVFVSGELPKNIATKEFIDNDFDENEQYINYVINSLEHIQYKIDQNARNNEIRSRNNEKALKNLLFLLACPVISFVAVNWFLILCYCFC